MGRVSVQVVVRPGEIGVYNGGSFFPFPQAVVSSLSLSHQYAGRRVVVGCGKNPRDCGLLHGNGKECMAGIRDGLQGLNAECGDGLEPEIVQSVMDAISWLPKQDG